MVSTLEELELDVVCRLWHADDLYPSLDLDAHLITWLFAGYTLLVRLSLGLVTGCRLDIKHYTAETAHEQL